MNEILFNLLIIQILILIKGTEQCTWQMNLIPHHAPLYFRLPDSKELYIPGINGMEFERGREINFVCPGSGNTLFAHGVQEKVFWCTNNDRLQAVETYDYNINNVYCTRRISTDLSRTGTCLMQSDNGDGINLGYATSSGFVTMIETCYNTAKETALYSVHTIYGSAAKQASRDRPSYFKTTGLKNGPITAYLYTFIGQFARIKDLLGTRKANSYVNLLTNLERGHISPDADFIFKTWAAPSYYLVNIAPQWNTINNGNWGKVEDKVRKYVRVHGVNATVITGVYGVLQLKDRCDRLVDIYLQDNNSMRVPKWFWKIVYIPATQEGIAFVTLNNPHADEFNGHETLCQNICRLTDWYDPAFEIEISGYTHCCDVTFLAATVGLPDVGMCSGQTARRYHHEYLMEPREDIIFEHSKVSNVNQPLRVMSLAFFVILHVT